MSLTHHILTLIDKRVSFYKTYILIILVVNFDNPRNIALLNVPITNLQENPYRAIKLCTAFYLHWYEFYFDIINNTEVP